MNYEGTLELWVAFPSLQNFWVRIINKKEEKFPSLQKKYIYVNK